MLAVLDNLARLAGMQAVIALTAIARNKVLALRLGPEGFGEFIQLTLVVLAASVIAGFGMGMSLNRNAAARPSQEERQKLLSQGNAVNLVATLVLAGAAILTLVFYPEALGLIGLVPNEQIILSLLVLLAYIPLDAAMHHRIGFLTGVQDIKGMTAGRSTALVLGTALSIPLVWFLGLFGAAIQFVLQTLLIVVLLDRRCRFLGFRPWAVAFDRGTFLTLAKLGAASIVAGVATQLSDLTVRSSLVRVRDAAEGGVYQAALSLTHQVRAVVLGSVGSYLVARLSQNTDRKVVSDTANQLLSIVLPIAVVAFGMLGLLSGPAIVLLYSSEFLGAQQVMPWLLTAYFVQIMVWVVGAPLLAMDRVGVWLALELAFSVSRLLLALPWLDAYGVQAVAGAYLAATVLHVIINWVYVHRILRLAIGPRQVAVFAVGIVMVAATATIGSASTFDLGRAVLGLALLAVAVVGCLHLLFGIGNAWAKLKGMFVKGGGHG